MAAFSDFITHSLRSPFDVSLTLGELKLTSK